MNVFNNYAKIKTIIANTPNINNEYKEAVNDLSKRLKKLIEYMKDMDDIGVYDSKEECQA